MMQLREANDVVKVKLPKEAVEFDVSESAVSEDYDFLDRLRQ